MNFENALKKILEWEGGYTNDPDDNGGETNYGITKFDALRAGYLDDMKKIPLDIVTSIYKKDYWDSIKCDLLPEYIKLFAFDTAVHLGVGKWNKYLSEGFGAENGWDLDKLYERREKSYTEISALKNNRKYLKGWMNRLNDIYKTCKKEINPELIPNKNSENDFIFILQQKSIDQISVIQLLCNNLLDESLEVDGVFGPDTENILRKLFKKVKN